MKITVIGNCQAFSFADYARHVLPAVEATLLDPFLLNDDAHIDYCVTALETADHVFAQPMGMGRQPAVRAAVEAAAAKTVEWPGFGFDGFQPDQFYLYDADRKFVRTPMGDYNSLLVAAAFAGGRSPAQTERLFNSLSYARLGYFEAFGKARAAARKWLERYGIDFDTVLDRWLAEGSFMLTINHPRMIVVAEIARRAMAQAGLAIEDDGSLPVDPLARLIWPVYPEIARRIGVPGSLDFVSDWGVPEPRILTLQDVVEGSFAVYDGPVADALRRDRKVQQAAQALGFELALPTVVMGSPQPGAGPAQTLTMLANAQASDRGTDHPHAHHYTRLYDMLLRPRRTSVRRMMEIGLCLGGPELGGPIDRQPADAPSIRMWLDYFPMATVQGFDISDFSFFEHPRFEFSRGDAGSAADLLAAAGERYDYDLIVDDASHASFHQQNAFRCLFPRLRPGGLYIIEDLHWQSPFYEDRLPATVKTAELIEHWFKTGSFPELPAAELEGFDRLAGDIDFAMVFQSPFRSEGWPKVAVIQKAWGLAPQAVLKLGRRTWRPPSA